MIRNNKFIYNFIFEINMSKQPLLDVDMKRDSRFGKDIQPESGPPNPTRGDRDDISELSDTSTP
jgi:hypothetical protein